MNSNEQILDLFRAHDEELRTIRLENVRDSIVGLDKHVPLFNGRQVRYVNLDNAATTPPLVPVLDCFHRFFELYASVHRGSGFKSLVSTHIYERCRKTVGEFIGADPSYHTLIFTPNATYALNKLAARLNPPSDGVVLCTLMEHHSNLLPWRRLGCRVEYAGIQRKDGSLDLSDLESRIRANSGRLRLVAVTAASNVTGSLPPIRRIARLAHEHGAMIAVDATQWVPHRAFRMGAPDDPERMDFAAFSGHKMYAPFGTGVLVGPREFFEKGEPDTVGGGTVNAVTRDDVIWAPVPDKEEAGTPNLAGAVALACAAKALQSIGMDNLAEHERELTRLALRGLSRMDDVTLYGLKDGDVGEDRLGVIALTAEGLPHAKLACILAHEWGIGVRNGCFCAQPYVRELLGISEQEMKGVLKRLALGDHATVPGMVRVSFGVYNKAEEVDYLLEALRAVLAHGPRAEYILDERYMEYVPDPPAVSPDDYIPF
jgi:selenocysteine lyase/cysteine desulfurase